LKFEFKEVKCAQHMGDETLRQKAENLWNHGISEENTAYAIFFYLLSKGYELPQVTLELVKWAMTFVSCGIGDHVAEKASKIAQVLYRAHPAETPSEVDITVAEAVVAGFGKFNNDTAIRKAETEEIGQSSWPKW
jgi:hypothetical protein